MLGNSRTRERRRAARTDGDSVSVTMHEIGSTRSTVTRGLLKNLSDRGVCLLTRDKIADRSNVSLRIEPWDWSGSGSARHCTPVKTQYMVGVELSGKLAKPNTQPHHPSET